MQIGLTVKDQNGKVQKIADDINNLSPEGKATAIAVVDHLAAQSQNTDIFLWTNHIDAIKRELNVELFLFNKNYTPYSVRVDSALNTQIMPIFLYDLLNTINLGAGTGLAVRDIDTTDANENILLVADLEKVGRAEALLHLIENERKDIVEFSEMEHSFKRIKGVVARFTHPTDSTAKCYVIKLMQQTTALSDGTIWQFKDGSFGPHMADATLKMPVDNQVLIVDKSIFVFDHTKFEKLFMYEARKIALAEAIGSKIDERYKLNMPTIGQGFAFMARETPGLMKKLLQVDIDLMDQESVLDTVDKLGVSLMTSDMGEIILMDKADVSTFLDLLNDNYVVGATDQHYIAKSKKPFESAE